MRLDLSFDLHQLRSDCDNSPWDQRERSDCVGDGAAVCLQRRYPASTRRFFRQSRCRRIWPFGNVLATGSSIGLLFLECHLLCPSVESEYFVVVGVVDTVDTGCRRWNWNTATRQKQQHDERGGTTKGTLTMAAMYLQTFHDSTSATYSVLVTFHRGITSAKELDEPRRACSSSFVQLATLVGDSGSSSEI